MRPRSAPRSMRAGTRNGSSTISGGVEQFHRVVRWTSPGCRRGPAGPGRRRRGAPVMSLAWSHSPQRQRDRRQPVRAPVRGQRRRGTCWPPRSCPGPTDPTTPAIDENITNADRSRSRVSSCRFHAASTLARSTASTRSGVSEPTTASSSTPGGVDHRGQRMLRRDTGEHRGQRVAVGDVDGDHLHLGPGRAQLGDQLRGPGRVGPRRDTSTRCRDTVVGDDVAGHRRTRHAGAAGDQHGARRPRVGHRHHDLADVAGLAQVPQRRGRAPHVPRRDRQRLQHAASNSLGEVEHVLVHPRPARLEQVEGAVAHARGTRRRRRRRRGCRSCPSRGTPRRGAAAAATRRRIRRPASPARRRPRAHR